MCSWLHHRNTRLIVLVAACLAVSVTAHAQTIQIDRPSDGEWVGNELNVEVALVSTTEIQSITAEVAGRGSSLTYDLPRDRFVGTISLRGLPAGEMENSHITDDERSSLKGSRLIWRLVATPTYRQ